MPVPPSALETTTVFEVCFIRVLCGRIPLIVGSPSRSVAALLAILCQKLCGYCFFFSSNRLRSGGLSLRADSAFTLHFHLQFGMQKSALTCAMPRDAARSGLGAGDGFAGGVKECIGSFFLLPVVSPRDCRIANPLEPAMTRRRHASPIHVMFWRHPLMTNSTITCRDESYGCFRDNVRLYGR
jgi:hypothetical protein